jgi:hypothetical protein
MEIFVVSSEINAMETSDSLYSEGIGNMEAQETILGTFGPLLLTEYCIFEKEIRVGIFANLYQNT